MTRPHARKFASTAWEHFEEDLLDPSRNPVPHDPTKADLYTQRLDYVGKFLLNSWRWPQAQALYKDAAARAKEYRETSGQRRHRGLLLANEAVACIAQGNYDEAIPLLMEAVEEDRQTYSIASDEESPALSLIFNNYYSQPLLQWALSVLNKIEPSVSLEDLKEFLRKTRMNGLCVVSYLHRLQVHTAALLRHDNEFSRSELLHAVRGIAGLIEVFLKKEAAARGSSQQNKTMGDAVQILFGKNPGPEKTWFASWKSDRDKIKADDPAEPINTKVSEIAKLPQGSVDERYYASLLTAYVIRNYTSHSDDAATQVVKEQLEKVLGRLLLVGAGFGNI